MRRRAAVAAAVAALVAALWWFARSPDAPAPPLTEALPPGAVARIGDWRFQPITSEVGLTADGAQLVGGASDGWVRLFDVATGREVRRFPAHTDATEPPGSGLFAQILNGRFRSSGMRPLPHDGVQHLAISPDGTRVATLGANVLRVFDLADGARVAEFETTFPHAVAWLPDGQRIAVASGTEIRRADVRDPAAGVVTIAPGVSGGGPRLPAVARIAFVSLGTGSTSRATDLDTGATLDDLAECGSGVADAGSDRVAFTRESDGRVWFRGADGATARGTADHDRWRCALAWTPDGAGVVVSDLAGTTVESPAGVLHRVPFPRALTVAFSADGRRAALQSPWGVQVFDTSSWQSVSPCAVRHRWGLPGFDPRDGALLLGGAQNSVERWDPRTGTLLSDVPLAGADGWVVAHFGDGVVGARAVRGFAVFDAQTGAPLADGLEWSTSIRRTAAGLACLVVRGPDAGSPSGVIRVDRPGGGPSTEIAPDAADLADGGHLLAEGRAALVFRRKSVVRVDVASGAVVASVPRPADFGSRGCDAAGTRVLFVHDEGAWRVVSLADGATVAEARRGRGREPIGALSPDGARLALAEFPYDTLRVIDLATGGDVARFAGLPDLVQWCVWSPDGRLLAVHCADGEILVYPGDGSR